MITMRMNSLDPIGKYTRSFFNSHFPTQFDHEMDKYKDRKTFGAIKG